MDREYKAPGDVARASPDAVHRSLQTVLRRGFDERPFLLRLRFQFDGGRTGPVLFIGNLNRSWRDYINGNARAIDMTTGTCTVGRGETGRTLIHLHVTGGRGETSGNLLELNRILRAINAEARFETPDGSSAVPERDAPVRGAAPARPVAAVPAVGTPAPEAAPAEGDAAPVDAAPAEAAPAEAAPAPVPDLRAAARVLRERLEAFKAAPSAAALTELNGLVAAWREALAAQPDMQGSREAEFVDKLAALLAAKGEAFVQQRAR